MKKNLDNLNRSNQLTHLWFRFRAGLRAIPSSFPRTFFSTLYVVAALALLYKAASPTDGILDRLLQPLLCIAVPVCAAAIFVVCVTFSAIPKGAASVADAFRRVHMTNAAGELSQIILDSTDAADRIPKDSQGLFLNQDNVLFRGYLFNDSREGVGQNVTQEET